MSTIAANTQIVSFKCTYVSTAVRINPKSGFEFRARSVQSFVAHLFPKYILSRHFIK